MTSPLSSLSRFTLCAAMLLGAVAMPLLQHTNARAATPTLTVTPNTAAPHATVQINGSGFDATTQGHAVLVDISLTTSTATYPLATVQTDASGQFGVGSVQQVTLPLNLDAPGPNQLVAVEEGNAALTAGTTLSGTVLTPQLNGGQPLSGQPGGTLDVKGTGFAPGDILTPTLNGAALSQQNGQQTINADATGAVDIPFVLPQSASGTQTLTVVGAAKGAGQNDQASLQITIGGSPGSGALQITPNPASVGTAVQVSATGFQPNEPVSFSLRYFDISLNSGAAVEAPATADSTGRATAVLTIPTTADGSKPATVVGRGITSGFSVAAQLTFAVLAKLTIQPASAPPGAQVTVSGSGFVPNEAIYATTRLFKTPIGHFAVTDATGSFSVTVTVLPTLAPGSVVSLGVSGSGGDNANATFTVAGASAAQISISPSSAAPGSQVTVSGQDFTAGEGLAFSIGNTQVPVNGQPPLTDGTGAFTATLTVPSGLAAGAYQLKVVGITSGLSATAQLMVAGGATTNRWYFAEGFTGQGPAVFFQDTLSLLNAGSKAVTGTISYLFTDGSTESLPVTVAAHSLMVEDVNHDIGPNRTFSMLVQTSGHITALRTITRTDKQKHVLDSDSSPGVSSAQQTWLFAEGYSGVSFQPYLVIQNPSGTNTVTATVTLFPSKGPAKQVTSVLAPNSRATLNLRGVLPNRSFGISVNATAPVVAERVEYWGSGSGSAKYGAGVKPGVTSPGTLWYFTANSVLNGDQSFLSLFNPGTKAARAQIVLFSGAGSVVGKTSVTVGAKQRATVLVNTYVSKHSPVTAVISASQALVAEEAQYIGGSPNTGSHAGAGIEGRQSSAHTWSFAAGDTGQYQEDEYVFNPSPHKPATVVATFYGVDHQVFSTTFSVKPLGVITVSANTLKGLHATAHGSVWTSQSAIVVAQVLRGKKSGVVLADQGIAQ